MGALFLVSISFIIIIIVEDESFFVEVKGINDFHTPHTDVPGQQFGASLRVIFHPPYALYYLTTANELIVVRVLHGARDTAMISGQGGFKTRRRDCAFNKIIRFKTPRQVRVFFDYSPALDSETLVNESFSIRHLSIAEESPCRVGDWMAIPGLTLLRPSDHADASFVRVSFPQTRHSAS